MCGIAGYFGSGGSKQILQDMNNVLQHRGPDGEGLFVDDNVGLAQRRLAIIDRVTGHQPMTSADGRYTITYNGELYNYLDLQSELEALGRTFVTHSDTEVVLQSFEQWGSDAFDRFNGMFALAIYDATEKRLTLARDHFGIKPLYFATTQSMVVFASEIKGILASGAVQAKPNDRIIYRYLRYRIHDDDRQTFFDGIDRLLPGEMMTIDPSGSKIISMYTTLMDDLEELAEQRIPYNNDECQEYLERLTQSVKLRLQSEVPVGTSLSGGLDSSAVVMLINWLMNSDQTATESVGTRQNTFTAVFPNSINDEERYADAVIDKCGQTVSAHKIYPTSEEFRRDVLDFVRTQEEPVISTGPYAQYAVMREAAKSVTVLLDGQGADEVMAGYIPYYLVYLRQLRAEGQWGTLLKEGIRSSDVLLRLARFRVKARLRGRRGVEIAPMLQKGFKSAYKTEKFPVTQSNLKKRLSEDIFRNSLQSLLRYEDRNTMRFSIEGRVPFLDTDLVRYVFSLSNEAIIKSSWNKRILRDAMKGILPDMIVKRRNKIGFTTPEVEWFDQIKDFVYEVFSSNEFESRPYFNQEKVLAAFEDQILGRTEPSPSTFWRILNVELWLREFVDTLSEEAPTATPAKGFFESNPGKDQDIATEVGTMRRFPVRTDKVAPNDDLDDYVKTHITEFFSRANQATPQDQDVFTRPWVFVISEKIVAITQGRSYFIWDIKPSWWARTLSKFVTRTPSGIGLGYPQTMQLAIQEVGLPRVLYASIGGALGKLVGKKGMFYNLVGSDVRAIDGPTKYSVYPANMSAKLAPKDPDDVAAKLSALIRESIPQQYAQNFQGTVVMDANDIGRNVLGKDAPLDNSVYEAMFADNPLGQAHEQTPICLVFQL